jgi:peptidoglycan/xylan/chitin deacetylase (PgdA/CDA1 family)
LKNLYKSFSALRGDQLVWKMDPRRLRILCYHGVCEDRLADQSWVPGFFVTRSAFEEQIRYLASHGRILSLSEAVRRLQDGTLPSRAVSITFDDGYANNLELAYPILQKYSAPATIFLSSAYMESGEMFPFLKVKLIKLILGAKLSPDALYDYKSTALDRVLERADRWWGDVRSSLSSDQWSALRPLTVTEVRNWDTKLVEFGAHSHTHCILKNETGERRREEIRLSVHKVSDWTGRRVSLFSYPNGQYRDFGEADIKALEAEGVQVAVTGIAGANSSKADPLWLKRYPVGIWHDIAAFQAEVAGLRTALLSLSRRLGSAN